MDPDPPLLMLGIGGCLCLLTFGAVIDLAFTAAGKHRLKVVLAPSDLAHLLQDAYRLKATLLLLNAGATLTATTLTLQLAQKLKFETQIAALGALLLTIYFFGTALPKVWAHHPPESILLALAKPLVFLTKSLWPFVALLNILAFPLTKLLGTQGSNKLSRVTEADLRLLVNVSEEEGLLEHEESEMIAGIFSFSETAVREIMIPRVDIVALESTDSLDTALETIMEHGHSRIPVYQGTIDSLIGVLYAKDLLPELRNGQSPKALKELVRPVHFVPATMKVDALLKDLQKSKVHLAVIVDEYGGTAGLATIEDLLEEIVGEIQDEYDEEEPAIQVISKSEILVDARVPLAEINDLLGLHLEAEEADRVGGLVYERLGRVPKVQDQVELGIVVITVLSVEGVRPQKLRISLLLA